MKINFLMLFCILVISGNASAQKQNWVEVPTEDQFYFGVHYIDTNSIERFPSGNVIFLRKMGNTITQFEVNCIAREFRTLKETELPSSIGQLILSSPSQETFPTVWKEFVNNGSIISSLANKVCSTPRPASGKTDKPATKKKAAKKKGRRNP